MGSELVKIGFLSILLILFIMFLNQMPTYLGGYSNYIAMAFVVIVGLMLVMAGK